VLKSKYLYDSSLDELTEDFIGFGAGSFSSYGRWKVINPTFQKYAHHLIQGHKMGLVAPRTKSSDYWKKFVRMISHLELHTSTEFPAFINLNILLMQMKGYAKDGELTKKGIYFAHRLTKMAFESLPFPLQNPTRIANYQTYISEAL
jgi:hypothetical protein